MRCLWETGIDSVKPVARWTTTRRFELLDVPSVSRLCRTARRVLTRKMETAMLRMVSAVRRGFRTVFFKMSRTVFIAVLL
jgi:hypothetical protein